MPITKQIRISHSPQRASLFGMVLLILVCYVPPVFADNLIVLSRNLDTYQKVARQISSDLNSPSLTVDLSQLSNQRFKLNTFKNVIAVGSKAGDILFNLLPAEQDLHITFLPKQTYQTLLKKYKNHQRIRNKTVSAIFLDQPFNRQLRLAKLLIPEAKVVATALGTTSSQLQPDIKSAAAKENLTLRHETLLEADNPIHKLQTLIDGSDFFLAVADKSVFNRSTAKWILYISFRQRIPLIGFSKKYVDAGALAAVYSSPEDIGRYTAEIIQKPKGKNTGINGYYPRYFTIALNPTAANSLRISLPSIDELNLQLKEMEK